MQPSASLVDIDPTLTDDEKAAVQTVRRFAREVMRPCGQKLDKLPADEVIAKGSVFWDVHKQYRDLGLHETEGMTALEQARLRYLTFEELGWGDSGLAISLSASTFPQVAATLTGNAAVIDAFKGTLGCWAITEPDLGTDMLDFGERLVPKGHKRKAPTCIAVKDGSEFVINGQKAAWVSNGTVANAAVLFCAADYGGGPSAMGVFLVRLDAPGVTRGKPLDKLGQRALPQGEIFFDGTRIPESYALGDAQMYPLLTEAVLAHANAGAMGSIFVGLGRAALELAIDYAKQRVQGGVPIIEHQNVKLKLFEMFRKVEAARALNRAVLNAMATTGQISLQHAVATKVTSTQTAFEVASDALQIFGGNGTSREYPIEKLFRDARSSLIEDGCNEILGLLAADRL